MRIPCTLALEEASIQFTLDVTGRETPRIGETVRFGRALTARVDRIAHDFGLSLEDETPSLELSTISYTRNASLGDLKDCLGHLPRVSGVRVT